jgi:hypothetical protein
MVGLKTTVASPLVAAKRSYADAATSLQEAKSARAKLAQAKPTQTKPAAPAIKIVSEADGWQTVQRKKAKKANIFAPMKVPMIYSLKALPFLIRPPRCPRSWCQRKLWSPNH